RALPRIVDAEDRRYLLCDAESPECRERAGRGERRGAGGWLAAEFECEPAGGSRAPTWCARVPGGFDRGRGALDARRGAVAGIDRERIVARVAGRGDYRGVCESRGAG